jgi:hypothetical protein
MMSDVCLHNNLNVVNNEYGARKAESRVQSNELRQSVVSSNHYLFGAAWLAADQEVQKVKFEIDRHNYLRASENRFKINSNNLRRQGIIRMPNRRRRYVYLSKGFPRVIYVRVTKL